MIPVKDLFQYCWKSQGSSQVWRRLRRRTALTEGQSTLCNKVPSQRKATSDSFSEENHSNCFSGREQLLQTYLIHSLGVTSMMSGPPLCLVSTEFPKGRWHPRPHQLISHQLKRKAMGNSRTPTQGCGSTQKKGLKGKLRQPRLDPGTLYSS